MISIRFSDVVELVAFNEECPILYGSYLLKENVGELRLEDFLRYLKFEVDIEKYKVD